MLTFRAADMEDVHQVFSDLSPISAEEIANDCGSWWKALPKVLTLLSVPDSQTEALLDESGTALAIFGHYPSKKPHIRTTWFVFSKGFMARGMAATRACHRRVQGLKSFYPNTSFHSFTTSGHPDRSRWFSMLGFRYCGTTGSGALHYVLLESDKLSDLGQFGQYNPTNPRAS